MKRGGIKISTFMLSMLVMSLFVVAFSSFFSEIGEKYGVSYDNESQTSVQAYDKFSEIQNTTSRINQTLFETETGSVTDLLGGFLGAGFNVLKLTGQSVSAFGGMVQSAGSELDLPISFTSIIMTIIALLVIFAIIGVLVGRDI